jgi:hypothetical protein
VRRRWWPTGCGDQAAAGGGRLQHPPLPYDYLFLVVALSLEAAMEARPSPEATLSFPSLAIQRGGTPSSSFTYSLFLFDGNDLHVFLDFSHLLLSPDFFY